MISPGHPRQVFLVFELGLSPQGHGFDEYECCLPTNPSKLTEMFTTQDLKGHFKVLT